jgi:hypothetical protein
MGHADQLVQRFDVKIVYGRYMAGKPVHVYDSEDRYDRRRQHGYRQHDKKPGAYFYVVQFKYPPYSTNTYTSVWFTSWYAISPKVIGPANTLRVLPSSPPYRKFNMQLHENTEWASLWPARCSLNAYS